MNEQIRETVERLERLFQKTHEGIPEGRSYIRKEMAPLLTQREGEILKDAVSEEVTRWQSEGSTTWSKKVRADALYRTSVWVRVAERAVAEEAAP